MNEAIGCMLLFVGQRSECIVDDDVVDDDHQVHSWISPEL